MQVIEKQDTSKLLYAYYTNVISVADAQLQLALVCFVSADPHDAAASDGRGRS